MTRTAAAWCLGGIAAILLTAIGAGPIVVMVVILAVGVLLNRLETR